MRKLFLLFLFLPTVALSDIYQFQDGRGNVYYSDTPDNGQAQKINVQDPASYSAPPVTMPITNVNPANQNAAGAVEPFVPNNQKQIVVESPVDQQSFNNQREIPIVTKVSPRLSPDNFVQVWVDGQLLGPPQNSTNFILQNPPRGTHQIYAELVDANNKVIRMSNTVVIYVHYAMLGPLSVLALPNFVPPSRQLINAIQNRGKNKTETLLGIAKRFQHPVV